MKIVVETEEEYNAWLAEQRTFGEMLESQQPDSPAEMDGQEENNVVQVQN